MTVHPEKYTLTREEWLAVNRALAGASLELSGYKPVTDNRIRKHLVKGAQEILSDSYERASQRSTAS